MVHYGRKCHAPRHYDLFCGQCLVMEAQKEGCQQK